MNIVISDPKTGNAYSKKTGEAVFLNRRIGDEVDLSVVGFPGIKATITGGSDKQGFPMKKSITASSRKKVLLKNGVGFRSNRKGAFKRKSVRGKVVSSEIQQLNLVVTAGNTGALQQLSAEKKEPEEKESIKDKMIKESLESVGKISTEDAKKIKGKTKH